MNDRLGSNENGRADGAQSEYMKHLYEGSEFLLSNQLQEAREALEKAMEIDPDDAKGLSLLGLIYYRLSDYEKAEQIYGKLVDRFPKEASLRVNLGLVLMMRQKPSDAIVQMKEAVKVEPDHQRAHVYLGHLYTELGDSDSARHEFMLAGQEHLAKNISHGGEESGDVSEHLKRVEDVDVTPMPEIKPGPEDGRIAEMKPFAPSSAGSDGSLKDFGVKAESQSDIDRGGVPEEPISAQNAPPSYERFQEPEKLTPVPSSVLGESSPEAPALEESSPEAPSDEGESADEEMSPEEAPSPEASSPEAPSDEGESADEEVSPEEAPHPEPSPPEESSPEAPSDEGESADEEVSPEEAPPLEPPPETASFDKPSSEEPPPPPPPPEELAYKERESASSVEGTVSSALERDRVESMKKTERGKHTGVEPIFSFAVDRILDPVTDLGGDFKVDENGALIAPVKEELFIREAGLVAYSQNLKYIPTMMRAKGKTLQEPLQDAGLGRMFQIQGDGLVVSSPGDEGKFIVLELYDDFIYLKQEAVFAFESSLYWENGRIRSTEVEIPLIHLRGEGRMALWTNGQIMKIRVQPEHPVVLPCHYLLGWMGKLVPTIRIPGSIEPMSSIPFLECSGEGVLLLRP